MSLPRKIAAVTILGSSAVGAFVSTKLAWQAHKAKNKPNLYTGLFFGLISIGAAWYAYKDLKANGLEEIVIDSKVPDKATKENS